MSLCAVAHPLHTGFTNIFGASCSEATIRPNPRRRWRTWRSRSLRRCSTQRASDCPCRKQPYLAGKRTARPYKSAIKPRST
jgi:hypothetical protein